MFGSCRLKHFERLFVTLRTAVGTISPHGPFVAVRGITQASFTYITIMPVWSYNKTMFLLFLNKE